MRKQRNFETDKKFDELLNKNCSWSYKSQKNKLNDTKSNKKRFQIMDIGLDAEVYDGKNKPESNDRSHYRKSKALSKDTPDKINAKNDSKRQKSGQIELNSFEMKTYGKTDKIEEKKPQNKCVKPSSSQLNKITTVNSTHHSILSSDSSSEDDVFQTRYSIFDKQYYEATDNTNDYALNFIEKNYDGEYTSGNISNMKTSPIIEIKSYEEKKYPVFDKQISIIKEQRENSLLKETESKTELRDYFREEENYSNTNIKSNYVQISDSFNADLDFSDNISTGKSNENCIKEMMVDITPKQHLVSKNIEKPRTVDEDIISEDFFNGTLDITAYQSVSSKTTEFSKQCENNKLKYAMQTKGKINHKRKIKELATENKRIKHETILKSKNKKNLLKTGQKAKKLNKKTSKKESNEDEHLNSYQMSNTFLNKVHPQQKRKKEKFDSFNININFLGLTDSPPENKQMKLNNYQMKYDDKNTYDAEEDNTKKKYSGRKVRSSSRIASKKIKEIEKIENFLDLDEEIIVTDETETNNDDLLSTRKEPNYMEKLYSLRGNSKTFQPKSSTNRKKEIEKIENFLDFDEEIIVTDETETNNDDLLSTRKEPNYMEKIYSLGGNSKTFEPKSSTNRKKEKHENKKSKMSMRRENGFTAVKERKDTVHHHLEKDKNNAKHNDDKLISRPIIHLLKSPHSSKTPVTQNKYIDNKKEASSLNSFYSYMANADQNLPKDNQIFEKSNKIDIGSRNSDLFCNSNAFFMGETSHTEDTNNLKFSKGYAKESKPRTWEMLENELLKDLDNEQLSHNVCKTVILKKQETVMKKEVAKDRNLFTVSNTSMLHTISKSKTGNKYNLKYEIKNTKSKFVGPKTDPTFNFKNTTIAQQMNRENSNFKSNAIVNKTIKAMEKCAAKFIAPEVKLRNPDHMVSNWQLKNQSDNSDTHQETQFHSHMTFMTNDDKKCYTNKIVNYMQKSNKAKKSCDFEKKGNLSKAIGNLSGTQRNNKNSRKALCTEYSYNPNKNNLPIDYPESNTNYDKSHALVPCGRERNNPWENLIDKFQLQEEYPGLEEETGISNIEMKDQNTESLIIKKTITQTLNNLEGNETLLIQADYEMNKTKLGEEPLSDQHIPADVESCTEQSEIYMPKTRNFSLKENLTSRSVSNHSNTEQIKYAEENNEICRKLEQQKINKNKIPEEQLSNTVSKKIVRKSPSFKIVRKSPSFKIERNKQGAIKLKKYSSGSSSSITSEDSPKLKKTQLHKTKGSECNNSVTNKSRDKYKKYLKKIFEDKNSVIDEDDKTKSEDNTASNENILKGPLDKSPKSLRKTKDSLIARQEDDIFSLSSSSSDESLDTSKKNYGTGPMCELFDEE